MSDESSVESRLQSIRPSLVRMIVRAIADGKGSPAEIAQSIARFSQASKLARDAAMGVVGYVMSLAPVRALPTATVLGWMARKGFASALVRTVETSKSSALMPRIADLAADTNASEVVDALYWRLVASLQRATVGGKPMYFADEAQNQGLASLIVGLMEKGVKRAPVTSPLFGFIANFVRLSAAERQRHAEKHGPMCLWDVSQISDFSGACTQKLSTDLFWDTSAATSMSGMFKGNTEFRGDVSTWDVSGVLTMDEMFAGSGIVDGVGSWDVGELQSARRMFAGALHVSPTLRLSRWNVGKCTDLSSMFAGSSVTDNGIGEWKLHAEAKTAGMLPASFTGSLHKWSEKHRSDARAAPAPHSPSPQAFGALGARSEDELVEDLFADELRKRERGGCAVQ